MKQHKAKKKLNDDVLCTTNLLHSCPREHCWWTAWLHPSFPCFQSASSQASCRVPSILPSCFLWAALLLLLLLLFSSSCNNVCHSLHFSCLGFTCREETRCKEDITWSTMLTSSGYLLVNVFLQNWARNSLALSPDSFWEISSTAVNFNTSLERRLNPLKTERAAWKFFWSWPSCCCQ